MAGGPPSVPDGAEMLQPLLLQGFLVLQHALHLLLHSWRSLDPLTGHELTGYPDASGPQRGEAAQGRWEGGDETHGKNIQNLSILTPLHLLPPHWGLWDNDERREGGREAEGKNHRAASEALALKAWDQQAQI